MLAIDIKGAGDLVALLKRVRHGEVISDTQLQSVLAGNAFYVDFYSHWEGLDRQTIADALVQFDEPGWRAGSLAGRLADGFRQAVDEMEFIESRMDWLAEVDPSGVSDRVLAFVPRGTPLDSTIHITVDAINGAILRTSLEPDADDEICLEAYNALALDMEDFQLRAAHYLGARMVQVMDGEHPRERIVECVQDLSRFLPLYNKAAERAGGYRFSSDLVRQFGQLFEARDPENLQKGRP